MIGIIGAMEVEISLLKSMLDNVQTTELAGMTFYSGSVSGQEVVVACAGIGKVHAAVCAQVMILNFHPDQVINIGVAGALDETLDIGDIVIATAAVQHDIDTSPIGDPVGLISGLNMVYLPCDESLAARLKENADVLNIKTARGVIATGDQFVETKEQKTKLHDVFGAYACDMEGGAIAQVCVENHVPYAAYRAVSDTLNGNGQEYTVNAAEAARQSQRLIKAMLMG